MEMQEVPVCIYATKAAAKEAEVKARLEIANVLKKYGVVAAVMALGMVHREGGEVLMNVGVEGAGSPDHAREIAADVCRPGLFA